MASGCIVIVVVVVARVVARVVAKVVAKVVVYGTIGASVAQRPTSPVSAPETSWRYTVAKEASQHCSTETGAVVPPCAWDQGGTRPATCAANQCCTGVGGAGRAPNENGLCPLSFQVQDDGVGASDAVVTGIRALVGFSTFTITTEVRPDPAELAATGFDTTCFIQGVVPLSATTQNGCAPQPTPADLVPPAGVLDSFVGVVPRTQLLFDVQARNLNRTNAQPCRPATTQPQLYRAFIDIVADGVTVVDTRDVYIVVPPQTPGGTN